MANNFFFRNLWVALPICCAVGCATHHNNVTPTAERGASRVYATNDPAFPPPKGVSPEQWQLSQEVQSLLLSDQKLAPYPSEVTIVVDKNTPGLVHLKGSIINTYERRKLRARIEQLPGVTQVDDQTVVGPRMPSGGGNYGAR